MDPINSNYHWSVLTQSSFDSSCFVPEESLLLLPYNNRVKFELTLWYSFNGKQANNFRNYYDSWNRSSQQIIDSNGNTLIVLRHWIWELGMKSQTILQDTCDDQFNDHCGLNTQQVNYCQYWLTADQTLRSFSFFVCSQINHSSYCACGFMMYISFALPLFFGTCGTHVVSSS